MAMKKLLILTAGLFISEGFSQMVAPARRPLILWADANDQDYYGYNNYYLENRRASKYPTKQCRAGKTQAHLCQSAFPQQ
jgi:hypothetical protein